MTNKKHWESTLDMKIDLKFKESYRLLRKAMKKPDPSISKLISVQMEEVTMLLLMRKTSKHLKEKDYDFEIDEDGDPFLHHKTEDRELQTINLEGYV
jgi:hypothetical protein